MDQRPNRDRYGRDIPPDRDHIGRIDRPDMRRNIGDVQRDWDRRDHGYNWYYWNGMRVSHHYDDFGFHWWGFYVGSVYFWTRYYDDDYWWYDPYWHRWCSLHDGQWWWQAPDGDIFVYTPNGYYRYGRYDSGVVITPDPTPPVVVPPGNPTPAPVNNEIHVYSLDGTRSVQVVGDGRDAYLYDLTIADPQSDAARGRYIGTQVAGVKFDYITKTADDGSETQAVQQIELTYDDSSSVSVADINGERRVDVSGESNSAVLVNLKDGGVDPMFLASGVRDTELAYQQTWDQDGNPAQSLVSITLTVVDGTGASALMSFDRDGSSLSSPSSSPAMFPQSRASAPAPDASAQLQKLQQKLGGSETFRALKSGFNW